MRLRSLTLLRLAAAWLASERQELGVVIGIVLLVAGLWGYSPDLALVVAGGVALWIHLPTRAPLIGRWPAEKDKH